MAKDGCQADLAKVNGGVISKATVPVCIGQLEQALLSRFPRKDAEDWDRMGLIAGDPAALVTGVLVALDPTPAAIEAAAANGDNVVLTHHPAFIEPPAAFRPLQEGSDYAGSVIYAALAQGIALMNVHTALDVSDEAAKLLPSLLSLDRQGILVPNREGSAKGYGQLCTVRQADRPLRLEQLAARCVSVFGSTPRVWGAPSEVISKVVIANGSASNVVGPCLDHHVDCLVCGEVRYHDALAAAQAGLCLIELGHDVSELPLCALLAQAAVDAGVPAERVCIFEQKDNWTSPDARRI